MTTRIDINRHRSSGLVRALFTMQQELNKAGLDKKLVELMKIRASQINGCAYCIDMHTKDARAAGETEQRIYALNAWREAPFYNDRERAALEWSETITRLADSHGVSDDLWDRMRAQFSEDELFALTFAVIAINSWNRLSVPFRPEVGSYQPAHAAATA